MKNKRRNFLTQIGLLGFTGFLTSCNHIFRSAFLNNHNKITPNAYAPTLEEEMCVIPTKHVEGPFYLKSPIRKDIKEDRNGIQLTLRLGLVNAEDCKPISGAVIEIWHCDAQGRYSGYPEDTARNFSKSLKFTGVKGMKGEKHIDAINEKMYLRGAQITDENGIVEFATIFPGWYEPRATHIHVKATINEKEQLDIQYYFEKTLSDYIYANNEYYKDFGTCPYNIDNDMALRKDKVINGVLLKTIWKSDNLLETSAKIGVHRQA